MNGSRLALLHLFSVCGTFHFHKPIIIILYALLWNLVTSQLCCDVSIMSVYVRGCICLRKVFFCASGEDGAASANGTNAVVIQVWVSSNCWRWWHLSASVTTQFALVFNAARQIDSPQFCSALADSQTALIGTNKSIFMHYSKVDSGASFKFNSGRLPSGHIFKVI